MKIAVAGTGYVGLSMATLLSQRHTVVALDIIPEKVEMINRRESPIQDEYIEKYFAEQDLDLTATLDTEIAYKGSSFRLLNTCSVCCLRSFSVKTTSIETPCFISSSVIIVI